MFKQILCLFINHLLRIQKFYYTVVEFFLQRTEYSTHLNRNSF